MNNTLKTACLLLMSIICNQLIAQKVSHYGLMFSYNLSKAYPQYSDYTTYDLALIPQILREGKDAKQYDELPYRIKVGNCIKAKNGDFHVVATLYKLSAVITSKSTATASIFVFVSVYDRAGNLLKEAGFNRDNHYMSLGRKFDDKEIEERDSTTTVIIQNSIDSALRGFNTAMAGSIVSRESSFAYLSDIKKLPDLKDFETHAYNIYKYYGRNDTAAYNASLEAAYPYWEKMKQYSGEADSIEVRRTALHNIVTYHLLKGNEAQARENLALYKAIDKLTSQPFPLPKIRFSDRCEAILNELYPGKKAGKQLLTGTASLADLVQQEKFITMKGTITLKGKRNPGTYEGTIQIRKIQLMPADVAIMKPDQPNDDVFITTKEGTHLSAKGSDVALIKVSDNELYTYKVTGSVMGMGGQGNYMKSSYVHPKIVVYRSFFPNGEDYLIKKTGDAEGIIMSPQHTRVRLIEYFADCPDLAARIKNKEIPDTETKEQLAERYANCSQ